MATTMNGLVRGALLDAARNIIRRGSIHDLTIAGMAAEANYARPTGYRYFSHPRDVVYAIAETTTTNLINRLDLKTEDFAADYARAAVKVFTSDPLVNRQVLLYAGVQSTEEAWLRQLGKLLAHSAATLEFVTTSKATTARTNTGIARTVRQNSALRPASRVAPLPTGQEGDT